MDPSDRAMRVLLIEDNHGDAAVVTQALAQSDMPRFEVQRVASLGEARERLAEPFDVLILDLQLPDSTGLRSADEILYAAPTTPIVVVSGTADPRTARRCIYWGASAFVSKDRLRPESLCAAVRGAIARGRPARG